jgi:hypothetical protein
MAVEMVINLAVYTLYNSAFSLSVCGRAGNAPRK